MRADEASAAAVGVIPQLLKLLSIEVQPSEGRLLSSVVGRVGVKSERERDKRVKE